MWEHFISASCGGEHCRICGEPATHKVGEEIPHDEPNPWPMATAKFMSIRGAGRHNFTAYVCCRHFRELFGDAVFCPPSSPDITARACDTADWVQVVLNGGPPCFHLMEDGRFCFRAARWVGHGLGGHTFVSLLDFYNKATTGR